jgi:threonine dehydrogenase-like Zn-dependent dehydrogenase
MKAITLQRLGEVAVEQRDPPRLIEPGDAIVKVTTAAICGSDLHIVSGSSAKRCTAITSSPIASTARSKSC